MTLRARPVAALDVGSNTIRLLVASRKGNGLRTDLDLTDYARLGTGVAETHMLEPERVDRAVEAIRTFVEAARQAGALEIMAVATSAVRDASNGPEFVERVRREVGINLEIVSGEREAELTYLGATHDMAIEGPVVVSDVGGGSAEIIAAGPEGMLWGQALPLGSGRMTEQYLHHDPPLKEEMEALAAQVREALRSLPSFQPQRAIFTGGSARYMARLLDLQQPATVVPAQMGEANMILLSRSAETIAGEYDIPLERAQVLPAGVGVLAAIASFYGVERITIARGGIREGMVVVMLRERG